MSELNELLRQLQAEAPEAYENLIKLIRAILDNPTDIFFIEAARRAIFDWLMTYRPDLYSLFMRIFAQMGRIIGVDLAGEGALAGAGAAAAGGAAEGGGTAGAGASGTGAATGGAVEGGATAGASGTGAAGATGATTGGAVEGGAIAGAGSSGAGAAGATAGGATAGGATAGGATAGGATAGTGATAGAGATGTGAAGATAGAGTTGAGTTGAGASGASGATLTGALAEVGLVVGAALAEVFLLFGLGLAAPAHSLGKLGFQWKSPCDERYEAILESFKQHVAKRGEYPKGATRGVTASLLRDAEKLIDRCDGFLKSCPDHPGVKAVRGSIRPIVEGYLAEYLQNL